MGERGEKRMSNMLVGNDNLWAHYSIDDVWKTLRWLTLHKPRNIFEMDFFRTLKEWHELFDARFTLYCIMRPPGHSWTFYDMPNEYEKDFMANADWLRFGFHAVTDKPFYEEKDGWQNEFFAFDKKRCQMRMGGTDCLRLHSWMLRDDQTAFLAEHGVSMILYKNEDDLPYDKDGFFEKQSMVFRRTDLWLEKIKLPVLLELEKNKSRNLVVFTHEWCFWEETDQMKAALAFHKKRGHVFY